MSIFKRLGDYIQPVDNRNKDHAITNLLGINITKNFMPSVANVSETDLSKYKVIEKGQFATNVMHVGRDKRLPVALYREDEPSIVSPAYKMFEVIDDNVLHPEFLMMQFERAEFDRLTWYYCDSSIRGGLDWDRFCDIEIPFPDIEEQKKYVAIYKGLLANQNSYENSLDDLQLICDTYIENLIKTEELKTLGDYIEKLDDKNTDNSIKDVLGISVTKEFRTPKSTVNKEKLHNYRIVNYDQFAYVQTTNNEKKLVVALSKFNHPIVVSSVNVVFKVIDSNILLPEFLFIFFKREEFDRYARFHSWGSARETFDWNEMCDVRLPIPDIKIQRAIVNIYHALESRKKINNKLKENIKPLCPVLMRGVVEGN